MDEQALVRRDQALAQGFPHPQSASLLRADDPAQVIQEAKLWADTLIAIAKATDLVVDEKYLKVEAWQTIARFNRCIIDTGWTKPIVDAQSGEKLGYEAQARLRRLADGLEIGTAEASCLFDEELERRDGEVVRRFEDDYACKSMAQTRAQGKMGRMAYAWVAVLAGYAPTPAEEIEGVAKPRTAKGVAFPFDLKGVDLRLKGRVPSELTAAELHAILPRWEEITAKAEPKYKESNQRLVTAIKEAVAEKTAPAQAGPDQPAADPRVEGARQPLGASPRDSTGFPGHVIPPAETAQTTLAMEAADRDKDQDARLWVARLLEQMERTGKGETAVRERLWNLKSPWLERLPTTAKDYAKWPPGALVVACQWLSTLPDKA